MRLWGRVWLGLSAAAMAAAVSGSAESALGAGEPPVRASAQAIAVLAPGAAAQGTGLVMAFGPSSAQGAYHYSDAIRAGWATATAAKHQGAAPSAEANTLLRHVRLLGGAVRVRKLWTSASLAEAADGTMHDLTGGDIHGLVVLGKHVHPAAGSTVPLGDWGTLAVLAAQPATQNGVVGSETITGLRLTLLHDHAGLAAGTVVALGTAKAAVTIPPAPTGGGSGGDRERAAAATRAAAAARRALRPRRRRTIRPSTTTVRGRSDTTPAVTPCARPPFTSPRPRTR